MSNSLGHGTVTSNSTLHQTGADAFPTFVRFAVMAVSGCRSCPDTHRPLTPPVNTGIQRHARGIRPASACNCKQLCEGRHAKVAQSAGNGSDTELPVHFSPVNPAAGIGHGCAEFVEVVPAGRRERPDRQRQQPRRVGAATPRVRGQERRIGLDEHRVDRDAAAAARNCGALRKVSTPGKDST